MDEFNMTPLNSGYAELAAARWRAIRPWAGSRLAGRVRGSGPRVALHLGGSFLEFDVGWSAKASSMWLVSESSASKGQCGRQDV
ncbi:hypothetical protein VTO73DRAFT_11262 [Trametes versicolor]